MSTAVGNVGVALALVCGAGAATAIGASVVFFPSLVKLASRRVLAGSLGLSAGVMTYVSFVEIFMKSVDGFALSFVKEGMSEEEVVRQEDIAYIYATLSFFGGVLTMMIVDVIVKWLSGENHHHGDDIQDAVNQNEPGCQKERDEQEEFVAPHCVGCGTDPVGELNEWQHRADQELEGRGDTHTKTSATIVSNELGPNSDDDSGGTPKDNDSDGNNDSDTFKENPEPELEGGNGNKVVVENAPKGADDEQKKLVKMGLSTAVAIAIHNFPEGLATFVAALDDPSVGAVLAIAIGIHNIPEGLCVALPIYYATGNRWKAFMWGCLSGLSEPVAALLGWAVLANAMSEDVYAILFGLVSGMMVIISMKELIPTAHRYDPEDTVVTYSLIAGMVIIALSLVLFKV
mmetsp:Transcript_27518/g.58804  ORF Transcript_27518/g.58804 Transcript_27518/m.58804 type:complete len:402 (+) Transcript_27518:159-1364(+)|eukprot:CAMPEP_0172326116 /NCGR_PEP_ID=MMETSP1058-20130122/55630_1 /TAXON_ID=83371 /ORGANISM="Detonula confervacea, Strain CCMP 353" /LENGTH=401 /DNA_ID=CAMNT_0013042823 /DNA_START=69 /DNA_END=1274 /DNA_ORIENTATION=-